jgi:uncharacterized protein (DUF302 family)
MIRKLLVAITVTAFGLGVSSAKAEDRVPVGYQTKLSQFSAEQTAERFVAALKARGIPVHGVFDHRRLAAQTLKKDLRPSVTVVFGHPMSGTPLMQAEPQAALMFPYRATAIERADGKTNLIYPDAPGLARFYGVSGIDSHLDHLVTNTERLTDYATGKTATLPTR